MQEGQYGYWTKLRPCYWGCNYCGAEIFAIGEPRWCVACQHDVWEDYMAQYRIACQEVHDNNIP